MNSLREKGKYVLALRMKDHRNIISIEKIVWEKYQLHAIAYLNCIYEVAAALNIRGNEPITSVYLRTVIKHLRQSQDMYFSASVFDEQRKDEEDASYTLENPPIVEEGVLECKCGSKRVLTMQSQTRSADEGATIDAECATCRRRWRE